MSSKQSYNNLTVVTGTYASDMTAYTPNAVQGGSGLYGIQADNYAVVSVKEDLLIEKSNLQKTFVLRRILNPMGTTDAIEFLLSKLKQTKTNGEFFESMNT